MSTIFKRALLLECVIICMMSGVYAQEEEDWEPQTFVSGYASSIAEFTNQNDHREANRDIGIGLAQVGFLVSHKPTPNIEIKGTFVWDQQIADLQSMMVEAYGIYSFSDQFKVGVGKFLTPLSPVNTYFYAPLNPSVSLPMVVTHYLLTPQSISGLQFAGELGSDWKVNYNVTYGSYTTFGHISTGIIGLIGREDVVQIIGTDFDNGRNRYELGGSARVAVEKGVFSLGLNYFEGTRATLPLSDVTAPGEIKAFTSRKFALGTDVHLNFNDRLKFNAEYWYAENGTKDIDENFNPTTGSNLDITSELDGWYAELLYTVGKFTPYIRYEEVNDISSRVFAGDPRVADPTGGFGVPLDPADPTNRTPWGTQLGELVLPTSAIGVGIAYRPIYELLLKADFRSIENVPNRYTLENSSTIQEERFYHFIMSAVFSF